MGRVTNPKYRTSNKKRDFLTSCGFSLISKPEVEQNPLTGAMQSVEIWSNRHGDRLYIHFDNTEEPNYCSLYVGSNERDVAYFSERNLISELRKHDVMEY